MDSLERKVGTYGERVTTACLGGISTEVRVV